MSDATLERVLDDNVAYRPDLARRPAPIVEAIVARLAPAALLVHERDHIHFSTIAARQAECQLIVYSTRGSTTCYENAESKRIRAIQEDTIEDAELEAVIAAERLSIRSPDNRPDIVTGDVVLVGAGIVNLVTALALVDHGHRVVVYDRMADPLADAGRARGELGATFAGEDARVFSFNEARHHLARSPDHAPDARLLFRRTVGDGGWLSRGSAELARDDRAWVAALEATPPWLAREYSSDIMRFCVRSLTGWHRLFAEHPQVLRGTGFVCRLLRVYQTAAGLARGRQVEAEIGALVGELSLAELAAHEPALARAIGAGAIAGALRVQGFSLQVKTLARNLIRLLAERGAEFHWSSALDDVGRDARGRVEALVIGGRRVHAASYVLSPGALGAGLRAQVAELSPVGAMAGMWVVLPNDEPRLTTPLKVGRRAFASDAAAEGANVIPGRDDAGRPVLFCSSGHGFVGIHPGEVERANLVELSRCIEETVAELFPDKRRAADAGAPRYCVRPWTPSGLGIFSADETAAGGRFVVTNGHNTGGFAQAPEVAAAVVDALAGAPHDMHALYGAGRGGRWSDSPIAGSPP